MSFPVLYCNRCAQYAVDVALNLSGRSWVLYPWMPLLVVSVMSGLLRCDFGLTGFGLVDLHDWIRIFFPTFCLFPSDVIVPVSQSGPMMAASDVAV